MLPNLEFDQLYIVSDLHFGGEPGFQIFGSPNEMIWLIRRLADSPADQKVGLVINGDFIDFLAEAPSKHFDPVGAIAKMERVALHDPTFSPIFKELQFFLSKPNCKLIINLGNHDLELTLPWVRERLIQILTGNDDAARTRLSLVFDGVGVFASVGGRSVLCVHGNEVDHWNPADFEKLRQIGRDYQFGRPVAEWAPNAGSKMVVDVMNSVKRDYPFVDLLKPEVEAVIPVLLACAPNKVRDLDNVLGLVDTLSTLVQAKVIKPNGMLGDNVDVLAQSNPASNEGLTEKMLQKLGFSQNVVQLDAEAMLSIAEQQTINGVNPLALVGVGANEKLGVMSAALSWLRDKPTSEVLREALDKLDQDRSFDTFDEDKTFQDLDREIPGDIDFLVAGHTHLERALKRRKSNGYYFNSGTWARLIKIEESTRKSPEKFSALFEVLKNGNMARLDATPGLILRFCTVVAIERDAEGVFGELRHVETKNGVTNFAPVPKSKFRKN